MKRIRLSALVLALLGVALWAGGVPARAEARHPSYLTLTSSATSMRIYAKVSLAARLKNRAGHALANRQVRLVSRAETGTAWSVESTKTTNSHGKAYWRVQEREGRVYRLRYMGSSKYRPDTSNDVKLRGHHYGISFSEEFSGSVVSTATWKPTLLWGDIANGFLQRYRPSALETTAGALVITASKSAETTYQYISGAVTSNGTPGHSFKYGYVETRAQIPAGQGLWSAVWLHSTVATSWDEIDVLETRGQLPKWNVMSLHYTTLSATGAVLPKQKGEHYQADDLSLAYHTYAVDWSASRVIWYRDGVERFRVTDPAMISDAYMYIVANLQMADGGWGGRPDGTTPFPSALKIDYIRVYKHD